MAREGGEMGFESLFFLLPVSRTPCLSNESVVVL